MSRRRRWPVSPEEFAAELEAERQGRAVDRAAATGWARRVLADPTAVILDTETTDLDGYVVQIAVLSMSGEVLLDTLVNPCAEVSAGAQRVHGLKAEDLASAPVFSEIEPQLRELLTGRRVVVYNAMFDHDILRNEIERLHGLPVDWDAPDARANYTRLIEQEREGRQAALDWLNVARWQCAMKRHAAWWGEWSEWHQDYRWQPLYGGDHSALGDCRAVLAVLKDMAEEPATKEAT